MRNGRGGKVGALVALALLAGGAGFVAVAAGGELRPDGAARPGADTSTPTTRTCVGAEAMLAAATRDCLIPPKDAPYEPPLGEGDVRGPGAPLGYEPGDLESVTTRIGSPGADTRILVVGDSHVRHWVSALVPYTRPGSQPRVSITSVYYGGCSLSSLAPAFRLRGQVDEPRIQRCELWKQDVRRLLAERADDFDLVIGGGTAYNQPYRDHSPAQLRDGVLEEWRDVAERTQVAFVRDTPRWPVDPIACLEEAGEAGRDPATCAIDADDGMRWPRADPFVAAARALDVPLLDMTDLLCSEAQDRCYAVIGSVRVMRDPSHLTEAYLETVAPIVWSRLRAEGLLER